MYGYWSVYIFRRVSHLTAVTTKVSGGITQTPTTFHNNHLSRCSIPTAPTAPAASQSGRILPISSRPNDPIGAGTLIYDHHLCGGTSTCSARPPPGVPRQTPLPRQSIDVKRGYTLTHGSRCFNTNYASHLDLEPSA